jgi:hypothetical protein
VGEAGVETERAQRDDLAVQLAAREIRASLR